MIVSIAPFYSFKKDGAQLKNTSDIKVGLYKASGIFASFLFIDGSYHNSSISCSNVHVTNLLFLRYLDHYSPIVYCRDLDLVDSVKD
ncbi:hypothetical protein [Coxiella endosymbiont of Amblyomma nuttalli]|uniref:hypothetical protein n=1 Tax=Coxiella endosymbiont of Amblyomma nuttalli TaxID=2749996 RepID=UPI001BA575D0|nr:hypothetical protein [Coxiella endosymbiont of Amblyomma nuttalli]QTS83663.1 hypothetical protein CEAn_00116 [Coxiella endosymbiont of Amblyomma nuttalli]